jgi:hypothetical protein
MPEPKDARRLIPDPENELDFYAVSSNYPLPDDLGFEMAKPVEESDGPKKRAASEPVTITRHASEASWFQKQLPPAKRPTLDSDASAIMGLVAAGPGSDVLSRLQDAININNQLLATALRAQLESVPQPQPQQQQQQQLPAFSSSSSTAELLAAVLRARGL